ERLLRYCASTVFMERLRKRGNKLVVPLPNSAASPPVTSVVPWQMRLHLTPLELIDRIAALVPPPRTHRHRYFGVLAQTRR
ncbi:MAG: transposase, partial [Rhodoferax sp.]|nr:transposase [Rhodoferax sp.]